MTQSIGCDCSETHNAEPLWLTRAELAERWHVLVTTLAQWAHKGTGPRFGRFGQQVRYRMEDVLAYEAQALEAGDSAEGVTE